MSIAEDNLLFLGTGTSYGVPMIGCRCEVCLSVDSRNKRTRCSSLLELGGQRILIDVTPDFRSQALRAGLDSLDAVIITHVHADHVFGLDDLRPLSLTRDEPLPVYADARTASQLRRLFDYVFVTEEKRRGIPWLALREIEVGKPFPLGGREFIGFHAQHGRGTSLGLRFGSAAYLTDAKVIPEVSREILRGVDIMALDMLREEPHPTHLCLEESLELRADVGSPRVHFIHMGHEVDHAALEVGLPAGCSLAYDGLRISLSER